MAAPTSFEAAATPFSSESPTTAASPSDLEVAATTTVILVIGRSNGGPRQDVGKVGVELKE